LAAAARGVHHHSATLGSGSAAKNRLMGWGRGYMLRRYGIVEGPRRAARVLLAEAAICAGQIIVDRNAAGVAGRIAGWRAARSLPRRVYGESGLTRLTLAESLRRRLARRRGVVRQA